MVSLSVLTLFFLPVPSWAMQTAIEMVNSGEFSVVSTLLEYTSPIGGKPFLSTIFQDNRPLTFFVAHDVGYEELKKANYLAKLMIPSYRMHLYSLMSSQITDQQVKDVLENPPDKSQPFIFDNLCGESINMYAGADNTVYLNSANNDFPAAMENPILSSDDALIIPTDNIMLPSWITMDIFGFMVEYDAYSCISTYTTFSSLLVAGNMDETVRESEDLTLFAPVNQGFPDDLVEDLFENPDALTDFLKNHMLSEIFNVRELTEMTILTTNLGECILANPTQKRGVLINESQLKGYHLARYGILYKISDALIPSAWI